MSIFEAGMMVCFGIRWPIAAYKTYKAKCVYGKSFTFSCLILTGYVCGIIHKLFFYRDWVIWLYLLNMSFLIIDMLLYLRYKNNQAPVIDNITKDELSEKKEN